MLCGARTTPDSHITKGCIRWAPTVVAEAQYPQRSTTYAEWNGEQFYDMLRSWH